MDDTPSTVEARITEDKQILLEQLRINHVIELACQRAEVGRSTYYRYRQQDPEFAKEADEAMREGILFINDIAEGSMISAIKNKNMSAIQLWLRTHHPAYATKLQISGTIEQLREDLTPDEQRVVEEALKLAAIIKKENINKLNDNDYENK